MKFGYFGIIFIILLLIPTSSSGLLIYHDNEFKVGASFNMVLADLKVNNSNNPAVLLPGTTHYVTPNDIGMLVNIEVTEVIAANLSRELSNRNDRLLFTQTSPSFSENIYSYSPLAHRPGFTTIDTHATPLLTPQFAIYNDWNYVKGQLDINLVTEENFLYDLLEL